MIVSVGADHAGFTLKEKLADRLRSEGYEVVDRGTVSTESVDYPEFAQRVAEDVAAGRADRGLLVCGSGVGMSIAANKVKGIRAANVATPEEAEFSRRHNDANVICVGERFISEDVASEIVDTFLSTGFDGGRHQRRVEKISRIENGEVLDAGE